VEELTPTEAFRRRLREVRASTGISQADLAARLDALDYKLSRGAIADIERGERRVSLDDALAVAAALGVAPLHLIVPFESDRVISEEAADIGIFEPVAELVVTPKLKMIPMVARSWIRGTAIHLDAPLDHWRTYYRDETPPARRRQLDQQAEWVRQHAAAKGRPVLPELEPLDEEREPEMAVPGFTTPENRAGFPASLWTVLMHEKGGTDG
jgi:transcriptional regulator with XRE-family HTH domain